MALCVVFPPFLVVLGIVAVVLALQFSRQLYLLEEGTAVAARGEDYPPLAEVRRPFRNIAQSISSISAGIQGAVEDKMRSERMKTELITNVSHDIRTPLTSLITYTDLLMSEGLDSEHAAEYLEVLVQKSQRLKSLTDELFEAAKAATGNVEVHAERLDLSALVRQSLGELDERVRASGLDFHLSLPDRAMVCADGRLVSRVMENLLSNVFKYAMPATRVYIDILTQGREYRLDLKNISAYPLNMNPSELTERFTRGDSARSGEGSGLGLSIVQSFVEAMGGRFVLCIDGDLFKATIVFPALDDVDGNPQER